MSGWAIAIRCHCFKDYLLMTRAIGIDALVELRDSGESVKHVRFD